MWTRVSQTDSFHLYFFLFFWFERGSLTPACSEARCDRIRAVGCQQQALPRASLVRLGSPSLAAYCRQRREQETTEDKGDKKLQ